MMTPRKIVQASRTLERALDMLNIQQNVIDRQRQEMIDLELCHTRIGRDLIAQFLIALDMPEQHDELRDKLHAALVDFGDQVARLEEQTR